MLTLLLVDNSKKQLLLLSWTTLSSIRLLFLGTCLSYQGWYGCPTSLAGGQSWEKLWFCTTLFEELCKHIVLSDWAEEEGSGWEGRTWEGRGWNLWWEHTQWGQEGYCFCFTHTAFIQACQSHPHLCHFQKTLKTPTCWVFLGAVK